MTAVKELKRSVLICSFPLFSSLFPLDSSLRSNLASVLSTVYCFSNLFFLGVAQKTVGSVCLIAARLSLCRDTRVQSTTTRTADPAKVSAIDRLRSALLLLIFTSVIATFPIIPFLLPSLTPTLALVVLLLITLTLGASTAYLQSAVIALAALWGSGEMISVMSGQGGIAVLVSGVQLALAIVTAMGAKSQGKAGDSDDGGGTGAEPAADEPSMAVGVCLWGLCALAAVGCLYASRFLQRHEQYAGVMRAKTASLPPAGAYDIGVGASNDGKTSRVFRKNAKVEFAVAWVFIVTLSVFPPITTAITSAHHPVPRLLQPGVFIPLHFLLFNVGDYLGRTYGPAIPVLFITSQPRILLLSLARTLFIPVFLACNITTATTTAADRAPLIHSDVAYFTILMLFGMTNGWISSLCMITASSPALNPGVEESEKDVAGTMAGFCLVAGLAGGSVASFGVNWFVRGSLV